MSPRMNYGWVRRLEDAFIALNFLWLTLSRDCVTLCTNEIDQYPGIAHEHGQVGPGGGGFGGGRDRARPRPADGAAIVP